MNIEFLLATASLLLIGAASAFTYQYASTKDPKWAAWAVLSGLMAVV